MLVHDVLSPVGQETAANNKRFASYHAGATGVSNSQKASLLRHRISDIKTICWNCVSRYGRLL